MRSFFRQKSVRRTIALIVSFLMFASQMQLFATAIEANNLPSTTEAVTPVSGYAIGDIITFGKVPDFSDYRVGGDAVNPPGAHPGLNINSAGTNDIARGLPLQWQIVDIVDGDKVILLFIEIITNIWNASN